MMRKAQILVEVVIAIGVAVVALLAISNITSRSVVSTASAFRQSQATGYAQGAIDVVRDIENSLGNAAASDPRLANGTWCFNGTIINPAITGYCAIGTTEFRGQITMSRSVINSKTELTAVANVSWQEGSVTRIVKNEGRVVFNQ